MNIQKESQEEKIKDLTASLNKMKSMMISVFTFLTIAAIVNTAIEKKEKKNKKTEIQQMQTQIKELENKITALQKQNSELQAKAEKMEINKTSDNLKHELDRAKIQIEVESYLAKREIAKTNNAIKF